MVKKILSCYIIVILICVGFLSSPVLAQNSANQKSEEPPDVEGVYDVKDKPNLKVRVFIHQPKTEIAPLLSCLDPDSSLPISPAGWRLPSNWTYNLNTSSVPGTIGSTSLVNLSSQSFTTWQAVTNAKVNFIEGANVYTNRKVYDGKNIIAWGSAPSSALAVTYIWYYPSTGLAAEVDTIMNKKFVWSWTPFASGVCGLSNTYDAQNILTHELGHWVGLKDMSSTDYQHATMYGYGSKAEIKKDTLTQGDKASSQALY